MILDEINDFAVLDGLFKPRGLKPDVFSSRSDGLSIVLWVDGDTQVEFHLGRAMPHTLERVSVFCGFCHNKKPGVT